MTDNFIQLKESNTLKIGIKDKNGNIIDGILEFDFENSGILLIYQDMVERIKKDKQWLNNQYLIIGKRQDVKGKKLLSKNEEDTLKAEQEFFKKIEKDYNMLLGENGVRKLLNGRELGWVTLSEIDEIIETQMFPLFNNYQNKIEEKIKNKYLNSVKKSVEEIEVIE